MKNVIPEKCPKSECIFMDSPTLCYRCALSKGYVDQKEEDQHTYINIQTCE